LSGSFEEAGYMAMTNLPFFEKRQKKQKKKQKQKTKKKAKKNPNSNTFQKNLLVPVGFTIDQVSRFILRILTRKVTEVKLI